MNLNYFATVKQDIDKVLATWIYSTSREGYMVITHSGNVQEEWKIENLCGFHKLNKATKKNLYPLPFFDEVLNTIARYKAYSFLDGYLRYHQIFITLEDKYKKTFVID